MKYYFLSPKNRFTLLLSLALWLLSLVGSNLAFAQDEQPAGEGGILENPDGFEMFGKEPTTPQQPAIAPTTGADTPPTDNTVGSETEMSEKNKADKLAKNKGSKVPGKINLDLDILYNVNIANPVVILDKRPEPVSFKTKEDNKYYYNQAILKVGTKDYEGAIKYLNKCINTEPYNKELLQLRANALTETYNFKKAVKDYLRVIEIEDKDPLIRYNLAATYLKMGKFQEAVESFGRAVELKPEYILAYQGRATARTYTKDFEGAIEDYNRVIDLNNQFLPAIKGRGIAKAMLQRYDEAVSDFTHIIDVSPMDGLTYYYRGLAYAAENQMLRACSDFDRAYQLNVPQAIQEIKLNCR